MARKPGKPTAASGPPRRRERGFEAAGGLMAARIQKAGESRGFAVTRLLTHWAEIVGPEMAAITRPVKMGYAREGLGATLSVLVSPAHAPMIEMRKEQLREKVNAVYGYNAIARLHLTQTSASGFAEGQADFNHAPKAERPAGELPAPGPEARRVAEGVADDGLRRALEQLAQNVLTRTRT